MAVALDPRPDGERWTHVLDADRESESPTRWHFRDATQAEEDHFFDLVHRLGEPTGLLEYAAEILCTLLVGVDDFGVPYERGPRGGASIAFVRRIRRDDRLELARAVNNRKPGADDAGKSEP